jgi:VWFA-related protein
MPTRFCLVLLTTITLFGQTTITPRFEQPSPQQSLPLRPARTTLRVDTNLALIPVTVLDPLGRLVTGLGADNFQIFEDGVPQRISSFGSEDSPLSMGIVLDTSGSMVDKLADSKKGITEFFKSANPEDEAFLVEFSNRPELVLPFTRNLANIEDRILFARPKGLTSLLDGVTLAIAEMKKAVNPRKALILLSDGGDNNSRYNVAEARRRLKESEVQIYALLINRVQTSFFPGRSLLSDLADLSGGRFYLVALPDMPDVAEKIGIELRNTYLLGYSPTNKARDGKYRSVVVKVSAPRMPKLTVSWRRGYFAPVK